MATALPLSLTARNLTLTVGSGDELDVRWFQVREQLSEGFDVDVLAICKNPDIDLGAITGKPARFAVAPGRFWSGICAEVEQTRVEEDGASHYRFRLVPQLWLLGQRSNYRVFQQMSELDIVLDVLGRWGITPRLDLSAGDFKPRRYRVQYGETDLAFVRRMLEDAGIAYFFEQVEEETVLVLSDRPNKAKATGLPIPFVGTPNDRITYEYVTAVKIAQRVRPGKFVQADVDWRRPPDAPIQGSAAGGGGIESQLELYSLDYGSFLFKANDGGGSTPVADDRGAQRTDDGEGAKRAQRRLDATRNDAIAVTFVSTAHDVRPGQVISFRGHPRADLGQPLLVESAVFQGEVNDTWTHRVEARSASADYRPPMVTPRPKPTGIESATVVGPPGEEIHTDEFGRVRVQFHWDREGSRDDKSSCWIPVSQNWGGASFGSVSLPRVGQEVLVDFLGGDPDRPVIMGRVFTQTQPVPYELPKFKTITGFRTETYPRPKPGGGGGSPQAFRMPLEEGADGGGGVPTPSHLPGLTGGPQADPQQLVGYITRMGAQGPDGTAHARSANEIMMRDDAENEQFHIQAQRDFSINVKRDWHGTINGNRMNSVHGNDTEEVTGYQNVKVVIDRGVTVTGKQTHTVTKSIKQESLTSSQYFFAMEDIVHACKVNRTNGSEMNLLRCGSSTIVMRPDFIIIQAKEVFLNPGDAATDAAIESGTKPQNAEERAASAEAAKQAAAQQAHERQVAEGRARAQAIKAANPQGRWESDYVYQTRLNNQMRQDLYRSFDSQRQPFGEQAINDVMRAEQL